MEDWAVRPERLLHHSNAVVWWSDHHHNMMILRILMKIIMIMIMLIMPRFMTMTMTISIIMLSLTACQTPFKCWFLYHYDDEMYKIWKPKWEILKTRNSKQAQTKENVAFWYIFDTKYNIQKRESGFPGNLLYKIRKHKIQNTVKVAFREIFYTK